MSTVADRILRGFSLVITDRRWAAPLSATALGFGLFVGVAIGPSAAGTLAGTAPIVEIAGGGEEGDAEVEAGGASGGVGGALGGGRDGGGATEPSPAPAPLAPAPIVPVPEEEPVPEPASPTPEGPEEGEGEEEEIELKGIVAQANPAAGSYALAIEGGELVPIHAAKLPPAGAKLTVLARRLANGTFAEAESPERSGKVAQLSFRGVVTYADPTPAAPAYTVSSPGASLLVHVDPDPTGGAPQLPARGSYVTVSAELKKPVAVADPHSPTTEPAPAETPSAAAAGPAPDPPCGRDPSRPAQVDPPAVLWQRQLKIEPGEPSTYLDLAGVVSAICPQTAQLLLSADGLDESAEDIMLALPARIDPGELGLGDSVLATAAVEPDGSLALTGLAVDEQIKGADDATAAQGDLRR